MTEVPRGRLESTDVPRGAGEILHGARDLQALRLRAPPLVGLAAERENQLSSLVQLERAEIRARFDSAQLPTSFWTWSASAELVTNPRPSISALPGSSASTSVPVNSEWPGTGPLSSASCSAMAEEMTPTADSLAEIVGVALRPALPVHHVAEGKPAVAGVEDDEHVASGEPREVGEERLELEEGARAVLFGPLRPSTGTR